MKIHIRNANQKNAARRQFRRAIFQNHRRRRNVFQNIRQIYRIEFIHRKFDVGQVGEINVGQILLFAGVIDGDVWELRAENLPTVAPCFEQEKSVTAADIEQCAFFFMEFIYFGDEIFWNVFVSPFRRFDFGGRAFVIFADDFAFLNVWNPVDVNQRTVSTARNRVIFFGFN